MRLRRIFKILTFVFPVAFLGIMGFLLGKIHGAIAGVMIGLILWLWVNLP